jgi:hypothetical protein
MDNPPKRRRRSFGVWAAVALVAGGVLYPLSIGPACWMMNHGWISLETYILLYTPVNTVVEKSPGPIAQGIEWYVDLWWDRPPALP